MKKIILYHGSSKIITNPQYKEGKIHNDYGQGFYCTEYIELSKEWACSENDIGYANKYELDIENLSILDLTSKKYNILNWIAILLENRIFNLTTPLQRKAKEYLLSNFMPDYKDFDIIIGYRADDAYFLFARAFINNEISLSQLSTAMKLGNLGVQYCIKTEKAFQKIKYIDCTSADNSIYYPRKKARVLKAKQDYLKELEKDDLDGIYIRDILKEEWKNGNTKLF